MGDVLLVRESDLLNTGDWLLQHSGEGLLLLSGGLCCLGEGLLGHSGNSRIDSDDDCGGSSGTDFLLEYPDDFRLEGFSISGSGLSLVICGALLQQSGIESLMVVSMEGFSQHWPGGVPRHFVDT